MFSVLNCANKPLSTYFFPRLLAKNEFYQITWNAFVLFLLIFGASIPYDYQTSLYPCLLHGPSGIPLLSTGHHFCSSFYTLKVSSSSCSNRIILHWWKGFTLPGLCFEDASRRTAADQWDRQSLARGLLSSNGVHLHHFHLLHSFLVPSLTSHRTMKLFVMCWWHYTFSLHKFGIL